jgi:Right handed beta helix region/IPT/TIG domain
MKIALWWILSFLCTLSPAFSESGNPAPPYLEYSDLVNGPPAGGPDSFGAIVTLFGAGFGKSQEDSSVTLADVPVRHVLRWSDREIIFQIDRAAKSGEVRVLANGKRSNSLPFAVTPGSIHFVATKGSDGNDGSFTSPWKTLSKAAYSSKPGDVTYVLDGAHQLTLDNYHAALSIQTSGRSSAPIALVAYPGAKVTIGDVAGPEFGIRTPAIHSGPFNYWIIAGFTIRGANTALKLDRVEGWRIVNNDFSCPSGDGAAACVEIAGSSEIKFLGNTVHEAGKLGASKRYQSVYFTTDTNHVEVGWNTIVHNASCRGIQFHSSPVSQDSGFNQFDLLIHDNEISGQTCDGLNLATIDPSKGRIAVFNNVIHHVGTGPRPPDGESSYTCISSPGIVNRGQAGSGKVEVFNNTLTDCGSQGGPTAGGLNVGGSSPGLELNHNVIDQCGRQPYLTSGSDLTHISGTQNLWLGNGPGPQQTSMNLSGSVQQARSPQSTCPSVRASEAAAADQCRTDHDIKGVARNQGARCSVGAVE